MTLEKRADGFFHHHVNVGEVTLHVAEARPHGSPDVVPAAVPLVVFLHGFPELWWSWRRQLTAFAAAGLWAVAPDLRGYNESEKPVGVVHYEIEKLAADIDGLVRALGRTTAIVVGHDWGAIVAWRVAEQYPAMVSRLAILNAAHALSFMKGIRRFEQIKKSWYVFAFQLPLLPEAMIRARDYEMIRKMFREDGIEASDLEPYIEALKMPGAVTAMVSYYRAVIRRVLTGRTPKVLKIECPVLVIWGDQDRALSKEMADPPKRFVPNARVVHIPEATHWVQNVAPDEVNRLLLEFVAQS